MSTELYWLVLTTSLTGALSLPYVLNIMARQWPILGLRLLASPPEPGEERFKWKWGERAYGAHTNAVENLVVFAPLAIAVHISGNSNDITVLACQVYFWARLIHPIFYIAGIPYVRSTSWTVGLIATFTLAYQLLIVM